MELMNGDISTYEQRFGWRMGEELFEQWTETQGYTLIRLGLSVMIDRGWELSPFIRNLPDYICITPKGRRLVQVKGSYNIKQQEHSLIPDMIKQYQTPHVPLYYAFCLTGHEPDLMTAQEVHDLYNEREPDLQYKMDGKIYRSLKDIKNDFSNHPSTP